MDQKISELTKFEQTHLSANLLECLINKEKSAITFLNGETYNVIVDGNINLANLIKNYGRNEATLTLENLIHKLDSSGQKSLAKRLIQLTPNKKTYNKDAEGRSEQFNDILERGDLGKAAGKIIKQVEQAKEEERLGTNINIAPIKIRTELLIDKAKSNEHLEGVLKRSGLKEALEYLGIDLSKYEF